MLGFDSPSFTYGTDLMLPVSANAELRTELEASPLSKEELNDIGSVPQVSFGDKLRACSQKKNTMSFAALSYSRGSAS